MMMVLERSVIPLLEGIVDFLRFTIIISNVRVGFFVLMEFFLGFVGYGRFFV